MVWSEEMRAKAWEAVTNQWAVRSAALKVFLMVELTAAQMVVPLVAPRGDLSGASWADKWVVHWAGQLGYELAGQMVGVKALKMDDSLAKIDNFFILVN